MRNIYKYVGALAFAAMSTSAIAQEKIFAATWQTPTNVISVYHVQKWAERVNELSEGKIEVQTEVGSARISPNGALEDLADGLVDVTYHAGQYTPAALNVSNAVEELGMLMTDTRVLLAAAADFDLNNPLAQEQWRRNGVVYIGPYVTPPYQLLCKRQVSTLEQLKDVRIRMVGRSSAAWLNEAGGVPVSINNNETYSALDRGALDCTSIMLMDIVSRKLSEVAKHVTELPITRLWAGQGWAFNRSKWQSLTPESRRIILDATADTLGIYWSDGLFKGEADAKAQLIDDGVQFHQPDSALEQSLVGFRDHQKVDAAQVMRETHQIDDPEKLIADFQSYVTKWTDLLKDVPMEDSTTLSNILRQEIYDKIDADTYGM